MKCKILFSLLLCFTTINAKTDYTGECKDLQNKIEENNADKISFNLKYCTHDDKGIAADYELYIDCATKDFALTQTHINSISTLTNLKKLSFYNCNSNKNNELNLEPLKKLEKVTEFASYSSNLPNLTEYFINLKIVDYLGYCPNAFSNKSIEELILTNVQYNGIKINFEVLTNLKILKLHTDKVGNLDISLPKSLKLLSLDNFNPTNNLLKQITTLENLESLFIYLEEFNVEKDDLSPLKGLTNFINLTELRISSWMEDTTIIIPDFIFSLKNLDILYLSNVKNTEILDNIGNLTKLEDLSLIDCHLTSIDKITTLSNLRYLSLLSNDITSLSDNIGNLKNLEYLDLDFNKIEDLPETLSNLKNLKYLTLFDNELTRIPDFLNKLPNLKYINFDNCENIKGKTLTNDSLEQCHYYGIPKGNICKAKEMECFLDEEEIPLCTENVENISINGKCGFEDGKCPSNECCSQYGYCGTSEKHCGTGCQSKFGQCTPTTNAKISTNGRCSPEDGKCPSNECCSQYGYCGTSEKHCGTGCQSEFGQCTSTTSVKISTNGRCGPEDGQCPSNECCSQYGYCGTNDDYCKAGCQSQFGKCF